MQFFNQIQFLQTKLNSLIEVSKNQYYACLSHKFLDAKTGQKSYWSILKTFLNNKKIVCIPPLLHQDKFVTDFKEKVNIFNNLFADQCSIVRNNSEFPATLTKKTRESLSTINFSTDDILGHDMIGTRMIAIPVHRKSDKQVLKTTD